LIESTGISEHLPVAKTFIFADESGQSLADMILVSKTDLVSKAHSNTNGNKYVIVLNGMKTLLMKIN
jgi:G3E family GTPase